MGDVLVARHRPVWTVVLAWFAMVVGGCAAGSNDVTTPPDTGAPPNTESTVTTTLAPSTTTTSKPDERGVVVSVAKARYHSEEVVELIIANGLEVEITMRDQQGFCTVVNIDQLVGEDWTPAAPCISGPPPTDLVLAAGASASIELPQFLEQGIYRGRLVYTIGDAFDVSATQEAVTDSFEVR